MCEIFGWLDLGGDALVISFEISDGACKLNGVLEIAGVWGIDEELEVEGFMGVDGGLEVEDDLEVDGAWEEDGRLEVDGD